MGLETVRVRVRSDDVVPVTVDDVVVRVFDSTGTTLITEGLTGAVDPGIVDFTLPGNTSPTRYQLRFYYAGGSAVSPKAVDVYSPASLAPGGTNDFDVSLHLIVASESPDPLLCRCSGYVRGPDGKPRRGVDLHFIPTFNPLVAGPSAVLGERVEVRSDKNGYITVDLFRNGIYDVTIESHENVQRKVNVPDRPAAPIANLLFPLVVGVTYDPPAPFSLLVGGTLVVYPTVLASDFREIGCAPDDVSYTIDNTAIASVEVLVDRIVVHGIAPGVTTLRVTRLDNSIVYIPDPGISGFEATITVT